MKLGIFTIVFNGMPFIQHQLPIFQQLPFDWCWSIAEGAAQNGADTAWCKPQAHGHSYDGTLEYIQEIEDGKQTCVISDPDWPHKTEMCNCALARLQDCDVLLQVDVDEFYTPEQIVKIVECFVSEPQLRVIRMPCRYFVGPDIVCEGEGCWSNKAAEWIRAWRFRKGCEFITHEPPSLDCQWEGRIMTKKQSRERGLVFDHYGYATLKQVEYKERFYGYTGLVNQWKALQAHQNFPVQLNQFFSFVDPIVTVRRLDHSAVPVILRSAL